jgi:hypothetical protein
MKQEARGDKDFLPLFRLIVGFLEKIEELILFCSRFSLSLQGKA